MADLKRCLTAEEGLAILTAAQAVNANLLRLNRAVFGDERPADPEDKYSMFGYELNNSVERTQATIEGLAKAIERGGDVNA